jgi:hypothetical protein
MANPIPAVAHKEAAVVRPVTECLVITIVPAPKNPIPLTTCAISLAGSALITPLILVKLVLY